MPASLLSDGHATKSLSCVGRFQYFANYDNFPRHRYSCLNNIRIVKYVFYLRKWIDKEQISTGHKVKKVYEKILCQRSADCRLQSSRTASSFLTRPILGRSGIEMDSFWICVLLSAGGGGGCYDLDSFHEKSLLKCFLINRQMQNI